MPILMNWNEIAEESGQFKSSPREKNNLAEAKLQRAVCSWLGMQFPNVYFVSDPSSLGAGWSTIRNIQAGKSKHAHLDMIIMEPSATHNFLILEFKKESPYLQSGLLSTEKHVQDQLKTMELLRSKGGKCEFVWSLDRAIKIIEEYLGKPKQEVNTNNIMHESHDR